MDMADFFPARLRALREAIGISQEEFAKKLGMARATISYYEGGHRTPDIAFLNKLCEITGCSLDFLMGRSNTMGSVNSEVTAAIGLQDRSIEALYLFQDKDIMNYVISHPRFFDLLRLMRKLSTDTLDLETREFKLFQMAGVIREIANDARQDEALKLSEYGFSLILENEDSSCEDDFQPVPEAFADEQIKQLRNLVFVGPNKEEALKEVERLERENWERVKDDPIYKFHQRMTRVSKKIEAEGESQ